MVALFDGLAGILADVFGEPVTYLRQGGAPPETVLSVFRRQPAEETDSDGRGILVMAPIWRVQAQLVPQLARGDRIIPGDGRTYEVLNVQPSASPAADAFVVCELYEVEL